MDLKEYIQMDAVGMAALLKEKEVSATELLNLSFKRLEQVNPVLNAFTETRRELAEKQSDPTFAGEFAGVPMALKNISQALKDEKLTAGSQLLKNMRAGQDSHLTAKLREAGFAFTGHTNTPEFGLKNITEPTLYGASRNPWNPEHSPGGSSGGSAAAIASGIVPIAGASDGGGSIRIPASFTGLFGLKPTRGRMPVGPGAGRQWQGASIDFALTKTVRDSAAMLDLLQTVQSAAAFHTPLFPGKYRVEMERAFARPMKIAFSEESPVGTPVSQEARQALRKTAKWLEQQGHIVEEKDNGIDGIGLMRDYYLMNSGEMALLVRNLQKAAGRPLTAEDMEIESWLLSQAGLQVSAADYSESLASWDKAAAKMAALHESYDFYLTPATAYSAPKIGELTHTEKSRHKLLADWEQASTLESQQQLIYGMFLPSLTYTPYTQLANLTGQPAISLPVHVTESGLPLGVQVMAGKGQEHLLLQLARQIEQTDLWQGMKGNPGLEI